MMTLLFSLLFSLSWAQDVPDSHGDLVPNDLGILSREHALILNSSFIQEIEKVDYPTAYGLLSKKLKKMSADHDTYFWFLKAKDINQGRGPAAMMIRNYVIIGLRLLGRTPPDLQKLSDAIAASVIGDVVQSVSVPPLQNVLAHDIQKAMSLGGIKDLAGWGGSFYYWRMPVVDEKTGAAVMDPLSTHPKDYLTIGDTILRDTDQRKRFITTCALAFKSVDPLTALSDPQGMVDALKNFKALPALVRDSILKAIFKSELN